MSRPAKQRLVADPGRRVGKPAGSHVDDMVTLRKAIILCFSCAHKFGDPKKRNYYKDRRFGYVQGKCDDCRQFYPRAFLFIHESFLAGPGNRSKHGHVWLPV